MLIDELHQDPKLIEAVGHSLGAHVVGHLGRSVFKSIEQKIKRVTGVSLGNFLKHNEKKAKKKKLAAK